MPMPPDHTPTPTTAFVLPLGFAIGGVETWAAAIARRLIEAGHPAVLLESPSSRRAAATPQAADGVPLIPLTGKSSDLSSYAAQLPAVFIPNGSIPAHAVLARLSRRHAAQMRILGMCHADDAYYYKVLSYYHPIIHRFVAVSSQAADKLRSVLPPDRAADVLIRPCGADVPRTLSRTYSRDPDPLRLIYAGRFEQRQKQVSQLVILARKLTEGAVNYQMTLIGQGEERTRLLDMLAASPPDVQRRVRIEGPLPPSQIPPRLREHDLCVLVSLFEGTSIFMLEGMANGCVPLVTRVSGTELIRDGTNGFCVAPGDIDAMVNRLTALDRDRPRLASMGAAAREAVLGFSYESYARWYSDLLRDLWNHPPRAWPLLRPRRLPPRPADILRRLRRAFGAHSARLGG